VRVVQGGMAVWRLFLKELQSRMDCNKLYGFCAASYPKSMTSWKRFVTKPHFIPMRGLTIFPDECRGSNVHGIYMSKSFTKFPNAHEVAYQVSELLFTKEVKIRKVFPKIDGSLFVFNVSNLVGYEPSFAWHSKGSSTNEYTLIYEWTAALPLISRLSKLRDSHPLAFLLDRVEPKFSLSLMFEFELKKAAIPYECKKHITNEAVLRFLEENEDGVLPPALRRIILTKEMNECLVRYVSMFISEQSCLGKSGPTQMPIFKMLAKRAVEAFKENWKTELPLFVSAIIESKLRYHLLGARLQSYLFVPKIGGELDAESAMEKAEGLEEYLLPPDEADAYLNIGGIDWLNGRSTFLALHEAADVKHEIEYLIKFADDVESIVKWFELMRKQRELNEGFVLWLEGNHETYSRALLNGSELPQYFWPDMLLKLKSAYYVYFVHGLKIGEVAKAIELFIDDLSDDEVQAIQEVMNLSNSVKALAKRLRDEKRLSEKEYMGIVKELERTKSMNITKVGEAKVKLERMVKFLKSRAGETTLH